MTRMGGRRRPSPPGGVPGHSVMISLGSLGSTPSPGTTVSANAGFDNAAAAQAGTQPHANHAVRRSISLLASFIVADQGIHPFPLRARRIVRPA